VSAAGPQQTPPPTRTASAPAECRDLPANDATSAALVVRLCAGASRGERDSAFRLGLLYRGGNGVPRDLGLALSYLRLAAQQGHEAARAMLATMGDVAGPPAGGGNALPAAPPQPLTRAECEAWPVSSATSRRLVLDTCDRAVRGDARAYAALGELFVSGKVVSRNEPLAVRLLRQAVQSGNREAMMRLVVLGYPPYDGASIRMVPPGTLTRQSKR
jgi:TPR repeat protein